MKELVGFALDLFQGFASGHGSACQCDPCKKVRALGRQAAGAVVSTAQARAARKRGAAEPAASTPAPKRSKRVQLPAAAGAIEVAAPARRAARADVVEGVITSSRRVDDE